MLTSAKTSNPERSGRRPATRRVLPLLAAIAALAAMTPLGCAPGADEGLNGGRGSADAGPPRNDAAGQRDSGIPTGEGERCGNGLDDDHNGLVDEGCSCTEGASQPCYPSDADEIGRGLCRRGTQACIGTGEFGTWGTCEGAVTPAREACGNAMDEDCNGTPDDATACTCSGTETRECYSGDPRHRGVGSCRPGTQRCRADGMGFGACEGEVLPMAESCDGVDSDCNGIVDDGCPTRIVSVPVMLDGDCLTARCPDEAPYPVGCAITMSGGDARGCIANDGISPIVYFQEGDACGAGHVTGTLSCSSEPMGGLTELNCAINKRVKYYPTTRGGCPDTD